MFLIGAEVPENAGTVRAADLTKMADLLVHHSSFVARDCRQTAPRRLDR